MNVEKLRSETPGCSEIIHLNNAGAALMPQPVIRAVEEHFRLESNVGGYEAEALRQSEIADAYTALADLLNANPRNIAFTENATSSFIQALSAIPLSKDDVIVTSMNDYASNQIQLLSLQKRIGIKIVRAQNRSTDGVDADDVKRLVQKHHPKLVCLTQVPTNSGLVQDVAAVGEICRFEGVPFLIDACQSIGQMPVDVVQLGCDFLSASSRKFLRGPRGAGFLFVSDFALERGLEPLYIDMHGADWIGEQEYRPQTSARRFENWEFSYGLVLGTAAAARYALNLGLDTIENRIRLLATYAREKLSDIPGVSVMDQGHQLCGIVSISIEGCNPVELVRELRKRGINTSAQKREYAVLDFDAKGISESLRISPHYYNTHEEIDQGLEVLRALVAERR